MQLLLNMKFFTILAALAPVCLCAAVPASARQADLEAETDRLLFNVSMSEFLSARQAQQPAGLDWSSDGCSSAPDNPFGFDFAPGCYRHDFGYRNYKAQDRFTDSAKASIDDNFHKDLYNICDAADAKTVADAVHATAASDDIGVPANDDEAQSLCTTTADIYYRAVVLFGKKKVEEVEATRE